MVIRISNLVDSTTKEDVLELFKKYGPLSEERRVVDRYTSKNSVIVFLNIQDESKGARAVKDFNGMEIENEIIEVTQVMN